MTDELRDTCMNFCDKIKKMFAENECEKLTDEDLGVWMHVAIPNGFISVDDACTYLGISKNRFYEYRSAGIIPAPIKIKGINNRLYVRRDIEIASDTLSILTPEELRVILTQKNYKSRGS